MKDEVEKSFESDLLLNQDPPPRPSLTKTILRVLGLTLVSCMILSTVAVCLWLKTLGVFRLDPNRIEVLANYNFQDNSLLFDRNHQKIGEYFDRYHVYTPFSELPQTFVNALVAIEDRNFFNHPGVDLKGITRAVVARLKTGRITQGASTITQQLVRNSILTTERSFERKILEIAWSLKAEKILTKEKILEIYTNTLFLGHGAYGVGAASQRYFGKSAQQLNLGESALIAGLYQAPSRYNPAKYPQRAKRRQIQVLNAMYKSGFISKEQLKQANSEPLNYKTYQYLNNQTASWFVDYIQDFLSKIPEFKNKNTKMSGLRIYTTLDSNLQHFAEESVKKFEPKFSELEAKSTPFTTSSHTLQKSRVEASMLVTDPQTGDILAMVGGRNYGDSQFNRTTMALRSPGSAFKPIVYSEALVHGFKWSDIIYVSPINIENYRPKNLEEDYLTETTMMRAFYRSMNAPTIELATKVGLSRIMDRAKKMGIRSPIKEEMGTVLGSSDVTMLDLARVYGSFATGGVLTEIAPITKITNSDGEILWERPDSLKRQNKVLNTQISYLMTQGLKSVLTSGTGSSSSDLAEFAAGKTGTSNDSTDNWFCGYTPNMVSIVWVGTDENTPLFSQATGGAVALPIWDMFVRSSFAVRKPQSFYRPEGITEVTVHPLYGHRVSSGARMYFLSSNQPQDTESPLERVEQSRNRNYRNVFRH